MIWIYISLLATLLPIECSEATYDAENLNNLYADFYNRLSGLYSHNHSNIIKKSDIILNQLVTKDDFQKIMSDAIQGMHGEGGILPTGLSPNCTKKIFTLVAPLLNVKDPAKLIQLLSVLPIGKMVDSWGKIPERILLGSVNWLGAFDECKHLDGAKYCLSGMKLFGKVQGMYGTCFPNECTNKDVSIVLGYLQNFTKGLVSFTKSDKPYSICEAPVEYGKGQIATFAVLAIILTLCLIGTLAEMIIERYRSKRSIITVQDTIQEDEHDDSYHITSDALEESDVKFLVTPTEVNENAVINVLLCFSLLKNIKLVLSTESPKGAITSINGIRVISMLWIILGHYYFVVTLIQPNNLANAFQLIHRFSFQAIANATVSVDTFFVLSGLLVAYLTLKRIDRKGGMGCGDICIYYIHRFVRLTPSLGLVILFWTNIFPIIISGPIGMVAHQRPLYQQHCYDYWWATLFYFNNFHPSYNEQCIGWTWYLANDMQFYIIAPFILLLMVHIEKKFTRGKLFNFLLLLFFCCVSLTILACFYGVWDISSVMTAAGFPGNPRSKNNWMMMDRIYVKPYTRISSYLVGLFIGYVISRGMDMSLTGRKNVIAVCGWITAIITALAVVYGPYCVFREKNQRFLNNVENVFYGTFQRFGWGCAVAWVIYACHHKAGGYINTFLSWKVWIPLSRLTYGAYLVHLIVYFYFFYGLERMYHYEESTMVFHFIGVAVMSYVCSFILSVCVECPIANLEQRLYKR